MTPARPLLLDSNVLYVLLVGEADRSQVGRARKTEAYGPESYDLLRMCMGDCTELLVTPNILTEVSNLAGYLTDGPLRHQVFKLIAALPVAYPERYVESLEAVRERAYGWLGLTDAVILVAGRTAAKVLTADALLHVALLKAGIEAVNFTHYRREYGDL